MYVIFLFGLLGKSMVIIKKQVKQEEEEEYRRLELRDHIYTICDTYIGSDQQVERDTWIYDLETDQPVQTTTTLPQGAERLFLEILSNAGDNALRSRAEGINPGIIQVTMDAQTVTIRNGGKPILVKINKEEKMWDPELIFGVLLTSSNYNKKKKRIGCGRNGYGAKLTSIFSKHFTVTIGDPIMKKHYFQEWRENMRDKTEPIIEDGYTGEAFTEISYTMDFERFGYDPEHGYPDETFGLYARYVYDYSQNVHTTTSFNGKVFEPATPKEHGTFYFGDVPMLLHYEWPEGTEVIVKRNGLQQAKDPMILPTCVLVLADTPNQGKCISFVNGMMTLEGGVHVNEALKAVSKPLLETLNGSSSGKSKKGKEEDKDKKTKLTWKDIKNHISLLLVCHLEDPQFGGQMKEKLTKPTPKFHIPDKTLAPILKWNLVLHLRAMMEDKIGKLMSKTDGKKKKHISTAKGCDANLAGGPRSKECILMVIEGDSAMNYAYVAQGAIENGTDLIGIMPFQGKPLNVMKASPTTIMENKEIAELKKFLGIQEFTDYTDERNFNRLRYGGLTILVDADDDGTHIKCLILLMFHCYYPSLLKRGYVSFLRTPLIRLPNNGPSFFSEAEYKLWRENTPNYQTYGKGRWFKGLGSSTKEEVKKDIQNPCYVKCIYDEDDPDFTAPDALELAFKKDRSHDRKKWIEEWNYTLEELNIGRLEELPISEIIDKELVVYAKSSLRRAIPCFMDGLKEGQRKILWSAYLIWGKKKKSAEKKVSALSAYVTEKMDYHHGEMSLNKTIIAMAQSFVGSNNMNYLYQGGMFGSRLMGGKDAASPRYVTTKLEWWFPYVFKEEDMDLLKLREEEGELIEPEFLLPILPMTLINGAHGVASGWSTFIPNHHPLHISDWLKAKLEGKDLPPVLPWYQGFIGDISIKLRTSASPKTPVITSRAPIPETEEEAEEGEERFVVSSEPTAGLTMVTKGRFEYQNGKVVVTELPIGLWTNPYKSWLDTLIEKKEIADMAGYCNDEKVRFEITGFVNANHKSLHLQRCYGLTNMVLLNKEEKPTRYKNTTAILEEFYQERLPFFAERRRRVINKYEEEIERLDAKSRFIQAVKDGLIDLNAPNEVIEERLEELQIPTWVRDMKTRSLATQGVDKLQSKIRTLQEELAIYREKTPEKLWYDDLIAFDEVWSKHEKKTGRKMKIMKKQR
jgi:DNA topoisomerase-2